MSSDGTQVAFLSLERPWLKALRRLNMFTKIRFLIPHTNWRITIKQDGDTGKRVKRRPPDANTPSVRIRASETNELFYGVSSRETITTLSSISSPFSLFPFSSDLLFLFFFGTFSSSRVRAFSFPPPLSPLPLLFLFPPCHKRASVCWEKKQGGAKLLVEKSFYSQEQK